MNIYGYTQIGGAALSTVSGLGQGLFSGDWSALGNAGKIFLGNFYLDENRGLGASWQGFSRHTWEFIQTGLGHSFAQIRNTFGAVDNVEYFGGATLSNRNRPEVAGGGMTLGPFILGTNLEASTNDWTFMQVMARDLGKTIHIFRSMKLDGMKQEQIDMQQDILTIFMTSNGVISEIQGVNLLHVL